MQQQNNSVPIRPTARSNRATGDWDVVLSHVSSFCRQSGLRYEELLELLGTRYINPVAARSRTLDFASIDPTSRHVRAEQARNRSRGDRTLTAADRRAVVASAFDRIHRFVRLWRALKWTARDLDKAITAFKPVRNGQPDLTPEFLVQLSHVERIRSQVNCRSCTCSPWWADIDVERIRITSRTTARQCRRCIRPLFSNRAAAGQSLPSSPATSPGRWMRTLRAIVASLRISAADLALLHGECERRAADDRPAPLTMP